MRGAEKGMRQTRDRERQSISEVERHEIQIMIARDGPRAFTTEKSPIEDQREEARLGRVID